MSTKYSLINMCWLTYDLSGFRGSLQSHHHFMGEGGCFGATEHLPVVPATQDEQKPQDEELSRDAQSSGPCLGVSAPYCQENKNNMVNPIPGGL